jgi:tRNA A-37 threonylcarbamoyl transferase component Bud32
MERFLLRDGVLWEFDGLKEEWADALFASLSWGGNESEVVNEKRWRRVVRIPAGRHALYLKHNREQGFFRSLRYLAAPTRARAEWRAARWLTERKIPTVRPLAVGERRKYGVPIESFLVTEGIDGALSLDRLVRDESVAPAGQRQIARSMGAIVGRFHREGFWHRDLHLGNFLAQPLGDSELAIRLIDLHKLRTPRNPGPRHWIFDLAWLAYGARSRTSRADRLRFLLAYLREMPEWRAGSGSTEAGTDRRGSWKAMARIVSGAADERARQHRRHRLRRAERGRIRFARERLPFGQVLRALDTHSDRIAAAVKLSEEDSGGVLIRDAPRARVVRVRLEDDSTLCVKRYRRAPVRRLLRDRARVAWRSAEGCRLRGVKTPRVLALVEGIPGSGESALVMEDLGHLPWLTHYSALVLRRPGVPGARRARFAAEVGDWVRRLHREGVRHADLKAGNVLVQESEGGTHFVLIDLEDIDFPGSLSGADRERALAQLNASLPPPVSATDRMRAFKAYARGGTFGGAKETRVALMRIVRESLARKHLWGAEARRWEPEPEGYGDPAETGGGLA